MAFTVVTGDLSVPAGSTLNIQPTGTAIWTVNNIFHEADVELYRVTPAGTFKFDTDPSGGAWYNMTWRVTNTNYIQVKNTNVAAKLVSYDGIVIA